MTSKLVGDVKLVGSVISCQVVAAVATGGRRGNPRVLASAAATDAVGMQLLLRDGGVFACRDGAEDALYHGEFGASAAILSAGYNLYSFMVRTVCVLYVLLLQ